MAFHIHEFREWAAGAGTAPKYSILFDLDCTLQSQTAQEATFLLEGSIVATNYPDNSRNSWPASDFALLTLGGFDPANYPFTNGVSYYQQPLPALPNAPQPYLDAMRIEFRGDTYRTTGPNRISVWTSDGGVMFNQVAMAGEYKVRLRQTFTLPLMGSPTQPVLIYTHSGANSATDYNWLSHEVWAELFNFDYRPGQIWNGSEWLSHNRNTGTRQLWAGENWKTLYTSNGPTGSNEAPTIWNGSRNQNMRRIGKE